MTMVNLCPIVTTTIVTATIPIISGSSIDRWQSNRFDQLTYRQITRLNSTIMPNIQLTDKSLKVERVTHVRKTADMNPRQGTKEFVARMNELRELGLECDPIQVLMEIAIGKKLVKKPGAPGTCPTDYTLEPVVGGYDRLNNPMTVEASTRAKAAAELCSYIFPKRKAIEHEVTDGTTVVFAVQPDVADEIEYQKTQPLTIDAAQENESADYSAGRRRRLSL
jgi:hypothetical protein